MGYTIEDCELYHLQYDGKSGKGRRRNNLRRDLSSKGSKSGGEGIDVVSIISFSISCCFDTYIHAETHTNHYIYILILYFLLLSVVSYNTYIVQ